MPPKKTPRSNNRRPSPASRKQTVPVSKFPAAWVWFADELLPSWVKTHYSPRESWKGKPFSTEDAHFFSKGVGELSELFTEERPTKLPDYFAHPRYRSGYLLYFLPLQAAKFLTIFEIHQAAIQAALKDGFEKGKIDLSIPAPLARQRPGDVVLYRAFDEEETPSWERPSLPAEWCFKMQAREFVRCVKEGSESISPASHAVRDLEVAVEYARMLARGCGSDEV